MHEKINSFSLFFFFFAEKFISIMKRKATTALRGVRIFNGWDNVGIGGNQTLILFIFSQKNSFFFNEEEQML